MTLKFQIAPINSTFEKKKKEPKKKKQFSFNSKQYKHEYRQKKEKIPENSVDSFLRKQTPDEGVRESVPVSAEDLVRAVTGEDLEDLVDVYNGEIGV